MAARFRNPANGYVEEIQSPGVSCLLAGCIYFASKGVWTHAVASLVLAICTAGVSWLIYPFFARSIMETHYLRLGWVPVTDGEESAGVATIQQRGRSKARKWVFIGLGVLFGVPALVMILVAVLVPRPKQTAQAPGSAAASASLDASAAAAPASNTGAWATQSHRSEIDDSTNVYVYLKADKAVTGWAGIAVPELRLVCQEGKTEAFVVTGIPAHLRADDGDFYVPATFRLDKEKAFEQRLSETTDHSAIAVREPIPFIKRLMTHDTLLIEFIPLNSSAVTTTFMIGGLSAAIEPVRKACHW